VVQHRQLLVRLLRQVAAIAARIPGGMAGHAAQVLVGMGYSPGANATGLTGGALAPDHPAIGIHSGPLDRATRPAILYPFTPDPSPSRSLLFFSFDSCDSCDSWFPFSSQYVSSISRKLASRGLTRLVKRRYRSWKPAPGTSVERPAVRMTLLLRSGRYSNPV